MVLNLNKLAFVFIFSCQYGNLVVLYKKKKLVKQAKKMVRSLTKTKTTTISATNTKTT